MIKHLEVKNLTKSFETNVFNGKHNIAFHDISFTLFKGQFLAIDGKNGYHKSSLLHCIYRNYNATSGSINLFDVDGKSVDITRLREHEMIEIRTNKIGYIKPFYKANPRIVSPLDIISPLLNRGYTEEQAIDKANRLIDYFEMPKNLWNAEVGLLTGIEKQFINILRELIIDPEIVLLQNPLAGFDGRYQQEILKIIKKIYQLTITVIGVFKNVGDVEHIADKILLIDESTHKTQAVYDPVHNLKNEFIHKAFF